MSPIKRVDCHKCKYYFVTWNASLPHGCRALGFRSKQLPSIVVFTSSGVPCQYFEAKKVENKKTGKRYI